MKWRYALPALFLALVAALGASGPTRDPDVFWHLRIAETALRTRSTLPADVFSYSAAGAPWHYKDLAADFVLYASFSLFGYWGLAALKTLAALCICATCHFIVRPAQRTPLGLVLCAGLALNSFWVIERPNLFSMALFPVTVVLLERARQAGAASSWREAMRALLPVAAVNVAWSVLHPFAILGHLLLVGAAAFAAMHRATRDRESARSLFAAPVPSEPFVRVAALLALATPALWYALPPGRGALGETLAMAASPELRQHILEWKRLGLGELWAAFPVAVLLTAAAIVGATWRIGRAFSRREEEARIGLWHLVLVAAPAVMTLASSVRWVPFAAIAAALVLALILGELLASARLPRGASVLAGLSVLLLARARGGNHPLALGLDPAWSPSGAAVFARDRGLHGDVVNSFELGGYLLWSLWPDVRVLVDGRCQQVYSASLLLESMRSEHDQAAFDAMRQRDGATWAMGINRPDAVAFGFLAREPAWAMVYWSDTAAIYVQADAHAELAADLGYRYVDPFDVPASVTAAIALHRADPVAGPRILAEIKRMLAASPDSVRANLALVSWLDAMGPPSWPERDAIVDRLLSLTEDAPQIVAVKRALSHEGSRSP